MIIVVFFCIVFVGFGLMSIIGKSIDASQQRKMSEAEVSELTQKQTDLTQKIQTLKTPEGQEDILREEYPVVSEGEHVVVITSADSNPEATSTTADKSTPQKGFWDYLKNLVK